MPEINEHQDQNSQKTRLQNKYLPIPLEYNSLLFKIYIL
jgi:hypothetical protein